jgi:glycosyltransferase involved in cell wall biosynthesis
MKIALVLAQKLDPTAGGVQRSTSKLAKIFHAKQHHVIIISIGNHATRSEMFEEITVFYINKGEKSHLKHILQKEEINCIINQMGYSVSLTALLLKSKSSPTKIINTLRINPLNFYSNHKDLIADFFERRNSSFLNTLVTRKLILAYHILKQNIELLFLIKKTNAFVTLSNRFKPELFFLVPSLKKYEHKIFGIANPFQRPTLDLGSLHKEKVILFVGRLNISQKRVDLLLQIWKKLHKEEPEWKFWIVGDGPERESMELFCKEQQLDRVTFWGKDNPNKYYERAKIFHMTSAFEGFGNVLVEAQCYGCVPILFDSYAAAQDIVVHDVNGILIKPFNIDAYVKQSRDLMRNETKLAQLSFKGFDYINKFSFEESYKKWDSVFKSMAS